MKKVIFTQEWMMMHPYEKPDEVDQYYTELANRIYHALDEGCFTHQFKNVDDAKQLALCLAAYFEDVISGTGIWKTFTTECKKRYGVHIPFYEHESDFIQNTLCDNDSVYDQDEINFADVKFLCWHHFQQSSYVREAVPFLFSTMELAAKLAYNILDQEYETAPENCRLYEYLCELPEEADEDDCEIFRRDMLIWFHYGCYFNLGNLKRLRLALQQIEQTHQALSEPMVYALQMELTINSRGNLLSLSSYEWLDRICLNQSTHRLWEDEDFKKKIEERDERPDHTQAINDYNLLKEKGYGDKFIFLEDTKAMKEFCKEIGFQKVNDIRFPQNYEKGIIVYGSPYTGINITYGLAHCIATPDNPYYNAERAGQDCFNIISGDGNLIPYEIVCKMIDNHMLPDANIFTSKYVKAEGLKITQANLQFFADYFLMGRPDKDISPKELC